jgi:hypothetical protein
MHKDFERDTRGEDFSLKNWSVGGNCSELLRAKCAIKAPLVPYKLLPLNSGNTTPVPDKSSPSCAQTSNSVQKRETQQRNSSRFSKPRAHLPAERVGNHEHIF